MHSTRLESTSTSVRTTTSNVEAEELDALVGRAMRDDHGRLDEFARALEVSDRRRVGGTVLLPRCSDFLVRRAAFGLVLERVGVELLQRVAQHLLHRAQEQRILGEHGHLLVNHDVVLCLIDAQDVDHDGHRRRVAGGGETT